ncbi:MAG: hypothetical protein RL330_348 [Actinomycetota bacterium]
MCARRILAAVLVAGTGALAACGGPDRTGTAFCGQLGRELPAIGMPVETSAQVAAMVDRYERLLARSPLTIEADMQVLTDLLRRAARMDPDDAVAVQELADAAWRAQRSAETVRAWVKSTCAVDLATGLFIDPPRTAPPTTVPATTVAPTGTDGTTTVP